MTTLPQNTMTTLPQNTMTNPNPLSRDTMCPNQTKCAFDTAEALQTPLALLYSLIFIFGLLGNLLALWVFLFLQRRRSSMHVLLINCAIADLVLLACLPFKVLYYSKGNHWALGPVACRLVMNMYYMNMYLSIALLGLISLNRYTWRSGSQGVRRWQCSGQRVWVACGLLWGVSLAVLMHMIFASEGNHVEGKCFRYKQRCRAKSKAYVNAALVVLFWVVFAMLAVSYGTIAARRNGRTARKSFFILFLFTVCFVPYHAFRPVYILSQLSPSPQSCDYLRLMFRTNEVMLLFSAFNSCLDPIMYFLLSGLVRKAARRVLGIHTG